MLALDSESTLTFRVNQGNREKTQTDHILRGVFTVLSFTETRVTSLTARCWRRPRVPITETFDGETRRRTCDPRVSSSLFADPSVVFVPDDDCDQPFGSLCPFFAPLPHTVTKSS